MTYYSENTPTLRHAGPGVAPDLLRLAAALLLFAALAVGISALSTGPEAVQDQPDWHGNVAASGAHL